LPSWILWRPHPPNQQARSSFLALVPKNVGNFCAMAEK
jgi:hypothetical protein